MVRIKKFIKFYILLAIIIGISCTTGNNNPKTPDNDDVTDELTADYYMKNTNKGWTVRQPAEWEPSSKVLVTYSQIGKYIPSNTTVDTAASEISLRTEYDTASGHLGGSYPYGATRWYKITTVPGKYYMIDAWGGDKVHSSNYWYNKGGTSFNGDGQFEVAAYTSSGNGAGAVSTTTNYKSETYTDVHASSFLATDTTYYMRITCFGQYGTDGNKLKLYIDYQDSEPNESTGDQKFFGIPYELIKKLSETKLSNNESVQVQVVTSNVENAKELIENAIGVKSNISYVNIRINDYWIRDYGPWGAFDANGGLKIVSHTYDQAGVKKPDYAEDGVTITFPKRFLNPILGSRVNDSQMAGKYGLLMDIPVEYLGLLHVGGNYMTDGQGTAFATNYFIPQNTVYHGYSESEIRSTMQSKLGIDRDFSNDIKDIYTGEGNHHIDCWAKIVDVDKIVVADFGSSITDYAYKNNRIQETINFLATQKTPYGTPYKIYKVFTGNPGESYGNGLIFNKRYFIPIKETNTENDSNAVAEFQEILPGYDVVPVAEKSSSPWLPNDALHCRTKEVPDPDMLYIEMDAVRNINDKIEFSAVIKNMNSTINISTAKVFYKINEEVTYASVDLVNQGSNSYKVAINKTNIGDKLYFYYYAEDSSLRKESIPVSGEDGPFEIVVK